VILVCGPQARARRHGPAAAAPLGRRVRPRAWQVSRAGGPPNTHNALTLCGMSSRLIGRLLANHTPQRTREQRWYMAHESRPQSVMVLPPPLSVGR
jgi:hypothetical protein